MNKKVYTAEWKASSSVDDEPGTFTAFASVFGNVDFQGDRVMKGAFDETLKQWRKSGRPVPVVLAHEWQDPWAHIGYVDPKDLAETDHGLEVRKGVLDIQTNPVAMQVYRLMKRGTLKDMSFAFHPEEEERAADGAYEIKSVKLIELGPCLVGANDQAGVTGVKSAEEQTILGVVTGMLQEFKEEVGEKAQFKADVDNSSWDGSAAMSRAANADNPAAYYRAICAGKREGDPDVQSTWALPHHKTNESPPNADGVRNALARLSSTEGLTNTDAAQSHLEAHMTAINPEKGIEEVGTKSGRIISKANESKIREAVASLQDVLSALESIEPETSDGTKVEEPDGAKAEESEIEKLKAELEALASGKDK